MLNQLLATAHRRLKMPLDPENVYIRLSLDVEYDQRVTHLL